MKCEKCGNEFEGNFCPECGEAAVKTKMYVQSAEWSLKEIFARTAEDLQKKKRFCAPFAVPR